MVNASRRVRAISAGALLIASLLLLPSAAFAQTGSRCRIDGWNTTVQAPNGTTTITLQRGSTCAITSQRTDVEMTVLMPPRSGRVTITNNVIIYQPRDGFVGNDTFMIERILPGNNGGVPRRTLAVNVVVQRDPVVAAAPKPPAAPGNPTPPSNWPSCQVDGFTIGGPATGMANPTFNSNAATPTMRLRSGGSCAINIQGPRLGLSVVTQPQHGSVTFDGNRITYQPTAGYVGNDTFTIRMMAPDRAQNNIGFISVNALVR